MDRLRSNPIALAAAVVALALALGGGYLYGSSSAAEESDAEAERLAAEEEAFANAQRVAWTEGLGRGLERGITQGAREGRERGRRRGAFAAASSLSAGVEVRAESRADIGGVPGGGATDIDRATGVLVVGDSLQVLTKPYLRRLVDVEELTINAVGGYNSFQIFDLFQQSYDPSQTVIVFDSGTNDNPAHPEILADRLRAVAEIVGNRCMVVPTIHGFTVNGIDNRGKNRVVRSFAASRPGTQTPDWAGAVKANPDKMQPDDLHPNPEGAQLRARLIADGIEGCLAHNAGF